MGIGSPTLSGKEKLTLITNLGTMLAAGVPIIEIVDALITDSKGNTRKLLSMLQRSLNEGKTISEAFSKAPKAFDPITINLIRAAEEAGTLDTTLKDLTKTIKKDMEFNDKVRASLTYPAFVIVIFGLVLLMILVFVVPRLQRVFTSLRVDLPPATQFLFDVSNLLLHNSLLFIVGGIALAIGVVVLYKTKKRAFVSALLSLPVLSKLGREMDLTRFTRSMHLLLSAGVPITDALVLAEQTVTKREIRKAISRMRVSVEGGKPLSNGIDKKHEVIPSIMVRTTEAAEMSGTLDKTMQELSEYFEGEVDSTLRMVSTLIEPMLLVVVGVMIGGMMLAVISPVYNLMSNIRR